MSPADVVEAVFPAAECRGRPIRGLDPFGAASWDWCDEMPKMYLVRVRSEASPSGPVADHTRDV